MNWPEELIWHLQQVSKLATSSLLSAMLRGRASCVMKLLLGSDSEEQWLETSNTHAAVVAKPKEDKTKKPLPKERLAWLYCQSISQATPTAEPTAET